jgi:hypothetical protein
MLYNEMNIHQKINFKSWRLSSGGKLFKEDYFPSPDSFAAWSCVLSECKEPLIPDLWKNLTANWDRKGFLYH